MARRDSKKPAGESGVLRAVMCRSIGASAWGNQLRLGGSGGPVALYDARQ